MICREAWDEEFAEFLSKKNDRQNKTTELGLFRAWWHEAQ